MLEGILLASNMAAKTTFLLISSSSFDSYAQMCCKRCHIIFLTFSLNGVGLKNQIRLLFFLRYDPPIVFRRQSHITFIFIKTMSHDLLVQMTYFSWIHIFDAFSLQRGTCEFKKQYTNSGVQRSPWSVFRKPQFFHTFSVILILSNYRKCMGKPRSCKNWSQTSLRSRFSVLFLWTHKLLFSKRKDQIDEFRKKQLALNSNTNLLIFRHLALIPQDANMNVNSSILSLYTSIY